MPSLQLHRRSLSSDHSGRVYFCTHPEDASAAKQRIDEILSLTDCIACLDGEPLGEESEEWVSLLSDMQLFVVLVSRRLLSEPSRARDEELALARSLHIPLLPILLEDVSLEEYNRVFPDIQYLDPRDQSDAALPYIQKLERALGEVLQSSAAREKIRESFDLSFFLSYRKKDRRGAQALLEKIHSKEKFQSVAIWYDEFLLPGEDFNHSIDAAMNESSLFLMSVTPNMLEPTNYVLDVEFPAALRKEMQIVAVETQSTNGSDFLDKFKDAPPLISIDDEDALFSALEKITDARPDAKKEETAERTYHIGLAYLNGIAVEVNRPLGVRLIREASDADCVSAIQKLITMYRCGDGVERDYAEVIRLRKSLSQYYYARFSAERALEDFIEYLSSLMDLAEEYKSLGDYDSARETLRKTMVDADRLRDANYLNSTGQRFMRIAAERLAGVERLAGNIDEAILILKSNLPFFRFELSESGSDSDRRALAVLLQELANLYAEKGNMTKSKKFADEAMALNEELLTRAEPTALDRYNLAVNLFNKAIGLSGEGKYTDAISVCYETMEMLKAAMEHHESYALYIRAHLLLGEQHEHLESPADAQAAFSDAVEICDSPSSPKDIVTLGLKAEALTSLGRVSLSLGNVYAARGSLRAADTLYEELIAQFGAKKLYWRRASVAFLDAQICGMQGLLQGAAYNYGKCIEYMETYTEEDPEPKDLHILALASYLLGSMNRSSPDVALLQKAFTIWNELASGENGEKYARHRDEVAAILVRLMF